LRRACAKAFAVLAATNAISWESPYSSDAWLHVAVPSGDSASDAVGPWRAYLPILDVP
jgi:hypothetical protein